MADPSLICIQKTPMYMSICGLVLALIYNAYVDMYNDLKTCYLYTKKFMSICGVLCVQKTC